MVVKNGKKYVVIYLEDWQMRMVKDFLGVECDKWEVEVGPTGLHPLYAVGVPKKKEAKRMYLTDWQTREFQDDTGEVCHYFELVKEGPPIFRYGLPASTVG